MLVLAAGIGLAASPAAQAAYPGHDGKVAYVITSPSGTSHDLWTVNTDGTGNRRLTSDGTSWHPRWSPDGKQIAFERSKDIYIMTSTGTLVRRVTTTGRAHQPTWSPNGKRLAFVNVLSNGHGDIFTVAATGGAITRITHDAATTCGDDRPTWSPLGGLIVYHQLINTGSGCTHNRILLVTLSSGAERVLIEDGGVGPNGPVTNPDFMPDGLHVLFMAKCFDVGDCVSVQSYNPVVVDLNGANPRFLDHSDATEGDYRSFETAGAPDGQRVVIATLSWPGDPPVDSFLFDPVARTTIVSVDQASVGTIAQPDWQPLP
ncbi:MAG TPA: DPP IV N-terminal domain-containing protein [Actinomycetota bacterium]